jgi:hypothetical protein
MLRARAPRQAYRANGDTLDAVTGTERPQWEVAFLRYGTVCKTTTIDGSGASDAHARSHLWIVRRWLYERGLRFMR